MLGSLFTQSEDPLELKPVEGALAELESAKAGLTLFFPDELPSIRHWVAFRIAKNNKFRRDEVSKEDTESTIFLPMPQNIATGYAAEYSNPGVGPFGALGATIGANIRNASNQDPQQIADSLVATAKGLDYQGLLDSTKYGLLNILAQGASEGAAAIAGAVAGGIPGAGVGAAAGGVVQGALAGAGIAANPGLATLFTGVNFRTHQFSYKFVPKSEAESLKLRGVIKLLKLAMSPSYLGENHFFDYPNQFDIEFHYPDYLFDIGASVLTGFDVNYSTEGGSYFNKDNSPVSVTMNMTFQELAIVTKQNIKSRNR